MIQSPDDLAEAMLAIVRRFLPTDEIKFTDPTVAEFVTPRVVTFLATTVESRQFTVTVEEKTYDPAAR